MNIRNPFTAMLTDMRTRKCSAILVLAIAGLVLMIAPTHAATIFLTNNTSPKTLASNEGDAFVGTTTLSGGGTESNGLDNDKTGDSTVLTLSADDGGGSITFNSVNVSGGKSLFMNNVSMGHGNEKWGANQNWTFTLDRTITFDALDFQNNENAYSLRSVAWKDDAAASGTGWSFSSDGTIGIFSLSSGQLYDFTTAGVSTVAAGTDIGFGAFGGANGGELLRSFTISPVPVLTWDAGGDEVDWNDGSNWSGDAVPTSDAIATINAGSATIAELAAGSASSVTVGAGGTLIVNGGLTADSVGVDGVLGGSGSITADVTINSGGTLSPGNSPGTLTVGELTLADGANELWEIDGSSYDQTIVTNTLAPFTGALTFDGTVNITIEPLAGALFSADQVFTLFTFDSQTGFVGGLSGDGTFSVAYGGNLDKWDTQEALFAQSGNTITLTGIAYIPEPSTMILAGLGLAGLMLRHRRGKKNGLSVRGGARSLSLLAVVGVVGVAMFFSSVSTQADIVLVTDFDNTGVSGSTMNGVNWTSAGLTAPASVSGSAAVRTGLTGTADAEGGYFSINVNINGSTEGSPAWSTTFAITVGGYDVELSDIVLASAEANSGGVLGSGNGSSNINLSIVDNTSFLTVFDNTQTRTDGSGTSEELTYAATNTLTAGNTYDVAFTVWELSSQGHFEAFDGVTFNGTLTIPEPSTMILAGLGLLGVTFRRRRRA